MMVDGEKSLDLLLSVLTCMTWYMSFTLGTLLLTQLGQYTLPLGHSSFVC